MSTDVTKGLLEALKGLCETGSVPPKPKAWEAGRSAIARAEAALAEPQPDADGWIPWAGGECPLADGVWHRVRFRDGYEPAPIENPLDWRWTATGLRSDIIAYRVVKR